MVAKDKRRGYGLGMQTRIGKSGKTYLFIKALKGSFHALVEVETKAALRDCGIKENDAEYTTRTMGKKLKIKTF